MNTEALRYSFSPRWKEELVCTCRLGDFVIEMPMGITTVYLPTAERWQVLAPEWARGHWEILHAQLAEWCARQHIPLQLDATATVYPNRK
jgi:hypothetical protein